MVRRGLGSLHRFWFVRTWDEDRTQLTNGTKGPGLRIEFWFQMDTSRIAQGSWFWEIPPFHHLGYLTDMSQSPLVTDPFLPRSIEVDVRRLA